MDLNDLGNQLEAQEQNFLKTEVLAPVVAGRPVTVRIAGVVCRLEVDDDTFHGWAILQPVDMRGALIMRPANKLEIQKYLQLLPSVQLITLARPEKMKDKNTWYALPAQKGDQRFQISKPVPVLLCEESVQPFDAILARFDGRRFWYEGPNRRRNPALAAYLRESFNGSLPPDQLQKKGLSSEEREAYEWALKSIEEALERARYNREVAGRRREEMRLVNALAHAQGQLLSYIERDNIYTVTYRVGNRTHTSLIRKDDLTVLTSGICLSGLDRDFDLTSVVGVMREAASFGMEDDY